MIVPVKICGLTTAAAVEAAVAGGAAFIGLNHFRPSPRYIDPQAAGALTRSVGPGCKRVSVVVDPDDALIDRIRQAFAPDYIQLHGSETPARAREIAERAGIGIIKVISVSGAEDFARAADFDGLVDHLMFDARPPADATLPGGVGARFDWSLMTGRRYQRPHFLAGGLDPWNVADAARISGAPIFDVSSGVERGPGLKDPALISAFLDAVRKSRS